MATGFLKFDHDHTVYIDLDLATDEVNKAVIIDADDVETPICGGGTSDFSTAQMTVHNNSDNSATVICAMTKTTLNTEMSEAGVSVGANETITVTIILYKGKAFITSDHMMSELSGDITIEPLGAIATGDCSITLIDGVS